ncbi:hypothetical protein DFA_08999 [Cavenderia fasciculata]|uniref:Proline dehydrogenase n=1 Tax=Cavenderia fasciculata TaxID=261658 RepID=F4Q6F1_CACFS|nr:uncharacterized protein DFA_08999 [Cavenderia fasciculata]EGG16461.1 hypothetical protein DFA_08999 [Cavenderia fasciculata]|eukprot:XP_004354861.1 hypothetical protein DFA_08999 [Cavenderia fasciculata]
MNKLQSTLIVEGSRYGSRILGNQQVVKFKSLKTSTSTFSSSSSSNQQIFNFKSNTNNHIGSSSSSLSSNNRVLYSTTITPPPPPLFNPTPPPTINNDDQQQDDEKQQQQQQNKKKNYSKYLLLGTAAGSVIVPLWYLLVDNDSLAPTLPHSPLDASQHGILLSQTINVEKIYASHSSSDLLFSYFILKLCTIPFLSENGSHMIELAQKYGLTKPMYWIVKQTFFKHFCAGEVIEETPKVADKLHQQGVGVVLDYSVEDQAGTSEAFDHVAAQIIQTVHVSTKTPSLSFSCVKVTGLTNPELLEKLNTIAQKCGVQQVTDVAYLKDPKLLYTNPSLVAATSAALSPRELKELSELVERLDSIFRVCHAQGIPILIDAEQTYYQHFSNHMQYNNNNNNNITTHKSQYI